MTDAQVSWLLFLRVRIDRRQDRVVVSTEVAAGTHEADDLTLELLVWLVDGCIQQLFELVVLVVARANQHSQALEQDEGTVALSADPEDEFIGQVHTHLHRLHHGVRQRHVDGALVVLED